MSPGTSLNSSSANTVRPLAVFAFGCVNMFTAFSAPPFTEYISFTSRKPKSSDASTSIGTSSSGLTLASLPGLRIFSVASSSFRASMK